MNRNERIKYLQALRERLVRESRTDLLRFTLSTMPTFEPADFHRRYYQALTSFAHGTIKKLMVFVPPQHGKQIADHQTVITPTGARKHGDLSVGDYVFGRYGNPVKVLWVSPKTQSEYVVTFTGGEQVECHGAHEWTVYDRSYRSERTLETRYIATQRLSSGKAGKRGHRYRFQVDAGCAVQFEKRSVLIDPYTLGAWLGDGKSSDPVLHIGCDDLQIVDNIPYPTKEGKGTTDRVFYIHGQRKAFSLYNLLGNKHIPEDYVYNSVEVCKQLIAGLIDTDGYVYQKNGRVTLSNTNKAIIERVAFVLRSLGQSVSVSEFVPQVSSSGIEGKKTCYQIGFNPTVDFPTVVPRKRITRLVQNRRRAIVSIERKEGLGYGNCIQVEGGVYLVGETIATFASGLLPTMNAGKRRVEPSDLPC